MGATKTNAKSAPPTLPALVALLIAALITAPGCTRDRADETDDPAAARALFDRAIAADLDGDALAAEDLMFELVRRHPDTPHGRAARSRLSSSGGAMIFGVTGIMAAVAIPAFMKYQRRSKTAEATMNVRKLFDGAVAYYHSERADRDGRILPPTFPPSTPPTPDRPFCEDGEDGFRADPADWQHPTWKALNFAIDSGHHHYQYQFISEGSGPGAQFTARALGDLNCDGVLSTFERIGVVDAEGNINGGAGLYTANEME